MNYEFKPASLCEGVNACAAMMTAAAQAYEPAYKAAARANLEVVGLASRRAQAMMDVPSRMMACRTPLDVMNASASYWQTAARQYGEAYAKIWGAYMGAMPAQPWGSSEARPAARAPEAEPVQPEVRQERQPAPRPRPAQPDRDAA